MGKKKSQKSKRSKGKTNSPIRKLGRIKQKSQFYQGQQSPASSREDDFDQVKSESILRHQHQSWIEQQNNSDINTILASINQDSLLQRQQFQSTLIYVLKDLQDNKQQSQDQQSQQIQPVKV